MNWPTFYKRTGSAIIFAVIMLFALSFSNELPFLILVFVIQFLCIKEYLKIVAAIFPDLERPKNMDWSMQIGGFVIIMSNLVLKNPHYSQDLLHNIGLNAIPLVSPFILVFTVILFAYGLNSKNHLGAGLEIIAGLMYISVPLLLFIKLYEMQQFLPFCIICLIWINDTMAYIVGSFIGKTPFSPISPKKTWEGTGGGALLTMLCGGFAGYYLQNSSINPGWSLTSWIVIALIVAVMGTMGDLFESKLKRLAGVKDSGNIMPGHGGALDRFDSLLGVLPFVYLYCEIFL